MAKHSSLPTPLRGIGIVILIAAVLAFAMPTGEGLIIGIVVFAAFAVWAVINSDSKGGTS